MKLIINSRRGSTAGGLGRYTGGDVFSSIGRNGLKHVINSATSSAMLQKVADAVVNGAQKAVGHVVGEKIVTAIKKDSRKRGASSALTPTPVKREKIDINKLIDGAGIILD